MERDGGGRCVVAGHVEEGAKRGRALGFPTLNIAAPKHIQLPFGIYAARVYIPSSKAEGASSGGLYRGVASLGVAPMFRRPNPLLEVHVFDFSGFVYGRRVRILLERFIRPERVFPNVGELLRAMRLDCQIAKLLLRKTEERRFSAGWGSKNHLRRGTATTASRN